MTLARDDLGASPGRDANPAASRVRTRGDQSSSVGVSLNRAEMAAKVIAGLAEAVEPGARLGTKSEMRARCAVSVGTFNEALKLAQTRGVVIVRPGPGGGLFAAAPSPIVRLGNSVLALDDEETSVADAVRMRDALDPLLVEDALWHSSAADIDDMRQHLGLMETAIADDDPTAFIRANWHLHACIARVSPNAILRSVYLSLLGLIESHTLAVKAVEGQSLPDYIAQRHDLHVRLVEAIASRDRPTALKLIDEHNTTLDRADQVSDDAPDRTGASP